MLRTAFLSLMLLVSLTSASYLRKSLARRQTEPEYCQVIEGFDCKCTLSRVTCTSDRDLSGTIKISTNEPQKYQSVELVINGEGAQTVHENTFEPVKQLYKPEAETVEFRIKFEKFSELHLSSSSIFNRVFPDNLPPTVRKVMALEIYNPLVQPNDNVHLFADLNVDSLELYALYPFRGTFQQLFSGANIKFLRLSGGDIRSDLSQPFTGNVGRLELAKQASQLSVQNFPAYPAHEYIVSAFYVSDFNSEHPPNYSNLIELRIHSIERLPANAFRQYPNLPSLSVTTEKDIDPHAFDGLNYLEKLTVKDTKQSSELLNKLHHVKEFETNIDKLSEREQCDLVEKLANGQVAVQAISNGYTCTCELAYLDAASGRFPCDAQNCEHSICPSIRDNFDTTTRTFKTPPPIKRSDGTDALRPREPKVYDSPYQVTRHDQEKYQRGSSQHSYANGGETDQHSMDHSDKSRDSQTSAYTGAPTVDHDKGDDESDNIPGEQQSDPSHSSGTDSKISETDQGEDGEHQQSEDGAHKEDHAGHTSDVAENQQAGEGGQEGTSQSDSSQSTETNAAIDSTNTQPPKKGFSWLPIIIVGVAVLALILIGLIILILKRKRTEPGYKKAATSEQAGSTPAKA